MTSHFVWLQGHRGPVPQVWHGPMKREKFDRPILAKHKLTDGEAVEAIAVGMQQLINRYPSPQRIAEMQREHELTTGLCQAISGAA